MFSEKNADALCVEVLVREDRQLSLAVAERSGVVHESPQVICLVGGKTVAHASHGGVTVEALQRAPALTALWGGPGISAGWRWRRGA